ncbi:MAG: hypothetical protein HOV83_29560 [Catenulispora sp.]|nr:hypothetical protein [Catenulispora sp.]
MRGTRTTLAEDFAAARAVIPTLADRSSDLLAGVRVPEAASPLPGWTAGDVAVHLALACTAYRAVVTGDFGVFDDIGGGERKPGPTDRAPEREPGPAERAPEREPAERGSGGPAVEPATPGPARPEADFDSWMASLPQRAELAERVTHLNALTVSQATSADRQAAPARIRAAAETVVAATAGRDPAEPCPVPWFGEDTQLQLSTVLGLFLSETLLHTLDVARASRQKWPIPPGTARLVLSLVFPELMARAVYRERAAKLDAAVRLHVRGGVTIGVEVLRGEVRAVRNPGPGRTDCHVSMDPVGFLLAASGRASQNRQIALGRMVPYGRKPWLAHRLAGLFYYP